MDSTTHAVTTLALPEPKDGNAQGELPSGSLYAIIPVHSGRYDVGKRQCTTIPCHDRTRALYDSKNTSHWSAYTHPEGKTYFCRNAQLRVVTDSYLYDQSVVDKLLPWITRVEKMVEDKAFTLDDSMELYVQMEGEDCNYYFADHAARAIFWLESFETSEVGLLPVVSDSHLKLQLEEQYWVHLEYFSMHPIKFNSNIIEETISHLTHGCGDHLTSNSSTFPYDIKECRRFLKLLIPCRDHLYDGNIISLVARLSSVITTNRYWTHYGQEQPRLGRTCAIMATDDREISWTQPIVSTLSLRSSDFFYSRLGAIFTDSYVYEADWRKFMSQSVNKWKRVFAMSLGLLFLHIFCFYLPISRTLAIISGSCLGFSLLVSGFLIHYLEDEEEGTATNAYNFLSKHRMPRFGYQGTALLFGLPQAFNLWGLVLMFAQVFTFTEPLYIASSISISIIAFVTFKLARRFRRISMFSPTKAPENSLPPV
ncbi:hypothetical protein CC1G_07677 [Coprinopsis cinerea okayama7|uniref:Uncharacterized protein n=1 Tax=Coprinopsis cinerea (strain Okayama-7 / 130 / ATCC MYA-4618 / FGSC 9003) TaxID=240176 RepID=A8NC73_COPC7|nr:hypothetical protein CC1G_07677 [Coprinopsis cinerea okayama7\|eukprot:XP_001832417.2 hypothetical protein CC1G_07677 [Coprinopsis cinerea okayama7\